MEAAASLSDTLFRKIEQQILRGEMSPGTQLPAQKDICATENLSRTVVREAIARLAAKGLVTSRQGSGVYVTDTARYSAFQITRDELHDLADVINLLEMRLAVEAEMAALAAARRTTADIGAIRESLRQMDEASDDSAEAARCDAAFHHAIASATRNEYFVRFNDFLGVRLVPPRGLYLRDSSAEAHHAYAEKVRSEHEAILDAIVRMDPERAREAARHHMRESLSRHSRLGAIAELRGGGR